MTSLMKEEKSKEIGKLGSAPKSYREKDNSLSMRHNNNEKV